MTTTEHDALRVLAMSGRLWFNACVYDSREGLNCNEKQLVAISHFMSTFVRA